MPGANTRLCDGLTEAMVPFSARYEYAITVEDMLARGSRLLFLDARLAGCLAAQVGEILYQETVSIRNPPPSLRWRNTIYTGLIKYSCQWMKSAA